jgi:hypothetical protein
LTKAQLQAVCIKGYSVWMAQHEWKRPRKPDSYDCRYSIPELKDYEANWPLIVDRLAKATPDPSLEKTEA